MIHEVMIECDSPFSSSGQKVRLKAKCKYTPSNPQQQWFFLEPQDSSIEILSLTTEDDISGLLDESVYEDCYTKVLDKVEDLIYGVQEGKFINIEAEE